METKDSNKMKEMKLFSWIWLIISISGIIAMMILDINLNYHGTNKIVMMVYPIFLMILVVIYNSITFAIAGVVIEIINKIRLHINIRQISKKCLYSQDIKNIFSKYNIEQSSDLLFKNNIHNSLAKGVYLVEQSGIS